MVRRRDSAAADNRFRIGVDQYQTVLQTRRNSSPSTPSLRHCALGRFTEHCRIHGLLELAGLQTVSRDYTLTGSVDSRSLDLCCESSFHCRHRMPADRTRTISHSSASRDTVGNVSALGAWQHHPLGLTAANSLKSFELMIFDGA